MAIAHCIISNPPPSLRIYYVVNIYYQTILLVVFLSFLSLSSIVASIFTPFYLSPCVQISFCLFSIVGFMDTKKRSSYINSWIFDVHFRWTLSGMYKTHSHDFHIQSQQHIHPHFSCLPLINIDYSDDRDWIVTMSGCNRVWEEVKNKPNKANKANKETLFIFSRYIPKRKQHRPQQI